MLEITGVCKKKTISFFSAFGDTDGFFFPPSAIRTKFNFNLALALALALAWEFFSTEGAEPPALKKIPMPMPKPMPMPN